MKVEPFVPDTGVSVAASSSPSQFARALDAVGSLLDGADAAEDAMARGNGSLHEAVYQRARADVALSVATATAQRAAQALTSLFTMQI